jgi:hypothetical protein
MIVSTIMNQAIWKVSEKAAHAMQRRAVGLLRFVNIPLL